MKLLKTPPSPEKQEIAIGYVRLVDSAPLIIADHLGFFRELGLEVSLQQEVSWANVRDKLATGYLDLAQMPSPLPIMTTCGASGLRVPLITGLVMSANGNAITLSERLGEQAAARRLREVVASDTHDITLAVVHGFSMHNLLLREWLRANDVNPEKDVRTIIVPPSQMVDSLQNGIIDGYCVGEPWNSMARFQGVGTIAATGDQILSNPEKVLATSAKWHDAHPATHLRVRLAVMHACEWLTDMDNRVTAAAILADSRYLDLPRAVLQPSLSTGVTTDIGVAQAADFLVFDGEVLRPSRANHEYLLRACAELIGKHFTQAQIDDLVTTCCRDDLFDEACEFVQGRGPVATDAHRLQAED